MYQEITHIKTVDEIAKFFKEKSFECFFSQNELKSVESKNQVKSLGARYLIKKSILDYFKLGDYYKDIKIRYGKNGKPEIFLDNNIKKEIKNTIHISLSHSRNYISTLVVIE